MQIEDSAHLEILTELRRLAIQVYGEERAGESVLQSALEAAAAAVWRVTLEPLEPSAEVP